MAVALAVAVAVVRCAFCCGVVVLWCGLWRPFKEILSLVRAGFESLATLTFGTLREKSPCFNGVRDQRKKRRKTKQEQ